MNTESKTQKVKIDLQKVSEWESNLDITQMLGKWFQDPEILTKLQEEFASAKPYPHILIEDFLDDKVANLFEAEFPKISEGDGKWHKYCNPIEVKYAMDNLENMPKTAQEVFNLLSTEGFIQRISEITKIPKLEADPYLLGAGLHSHPKNGRLNVHLDFEIHPVTGKERRLNIILFLSKDWNPEWEGGLEIWEKNMSACAKTFYPKFNSAVLFQTNDVSWHGLPKKIKAPEGKNRQSLAIYYMSEPETKKSFGMYRLKAKFVKRPEDPEDPRMKQLYEIRALRRINPADMQEIYPEWNPEEY
jgi:Rps23 Pro-64 3,4-dihydroxylase Tpa1-like proline 4-hydroxylase